MCKGNSPGCNCCNSLFFWSSRGLPGNSFEYMYQGAETYRHNGSPGAHGTIPGRLQSLEVWPGALLGRDHDVIYTVHTEGGGDSSQNFLKQYSAKSPTLNWKVPYPSRSGGGNDHQDILVGEHGIQIGANLFTESGHRMHVSKDGELLSPSKPVHSQIAADTPAGLLYPFVVDAPPIYVRRSNAVAGASAIATADTKKLLYGLNPSLFGQSPWISQNSNHYAFCLLTHTGTETGGNPPTITYTHSYDYQIYIAEMRFAEVGGQYILDLTEAEEIPGYSHYNPQAVHSITSGTSEENQGRKDSGRIHANTGLRIHVTLAKGEELYWVVRSKQSPEEEDLAHPGMRVNTQLHLPGLPNYKGGVREATPASPSPDGTACVEDGYLTETISDDREEYLLPFAMPTVPAEPGGRARNEGGAPLTTIGLLGFPGNKISYKYVKLDLKFYADRIHRSTAHPPIACKGFYDPPRLEKGFLVAGTESGSDAQEVTIPLFSYDITSATNVNINHTGNAWSLFLSALWANWVPVSSGWVIGHLSFSLRFEAGGHATLNQFLVDVFPLLSEADIEILEDQFEEEQSPEIERRAYIGDYLLSYDHTHLIGIPTHSQLHHVWNPVHGLLHGLTRTPSQILEVDSVSLRNKVRMNSEALSSTINDGQSATFTVNFLDLAEGIFQETEVEVGRMVKPFHRVLEELEMDDFFVCTSGGVQYDTPVFSKTSDLAYKITLPNCRTSGNSVGGIKIALRTPVQIVSKTNYIKVLSHPARTQEVAVRP